MKAVARFGGSMRKKYYDPYANYFVKFLQNYSSEA